MTERNTKGRILDAAERLFARDGFHATSLRNITREASVNLAAVNYHFGSKEALISEVISRRMVPINRMRMGRLRAVMAESVNQQARPDVSEILSVFFRPTLVFLETSSQAKEFVTIIGRAMSEPDDTVRNILIGHLEPVFRYLLEILCFALPHVPYRVLYWRLQFALGAFSHVMRTARDPIFMPDDLKPEEDIGSIIDVLIPFLTAGMEEAVE